MLTRAIGRPPRRTLYAALAGACMLGAVRTTAAAQDRDRSDAGVTTIDTTIAFSPSGSVDFELIAGSMTVRTWDRNDVRVVANATGDARIELDASRSHIDMEQSRRDRWGARGGGGTVTYQVTVPAGVRGTLGAVSGSIDVAGVRGGLEVSTVSGAATVRDVGQSVSVEAVSGRINVANVQGDAHLESVSSAIGISNVSGSLSAESVSGSISISGVRGTRVRANSVSGRLDFTGAINPSGHYDFDSHSGRVTLRLASNASATVSVNTFSGWESSDYPGAVRRPGSDDENGRTYEYILGRGDARVRVQTFSGTVFITQENK